MRACFIYDNMIITDSTYILVLSHTLQEVVKYLSEIFCSISRPNKIFTKLCESIK